MEPYQTRRALESTAVIAVVLLLAAVLALFVMFAVGWGVGPMIIVTAAFVLLGVLHYLVWGRRQARAVAVKRVRQEPSGTGGR